jgi:hypothetical protein
MEKINLLLTQSVPLPVRSGLGLWKEVSKWIREISEVFHVAKRRTAKDTEF